MAVVKKPQRTSPIWSINMLAALHFIRCIILLSDVSFMLYFFIYNYNRIDMGGPSVILLFVPAIFIELGTGFLFLWERMGAAIVALFYFTTLILFPFSLIAFLVLYILALPYLITILVEVLLLVILGVNWVNQEWVRDTPE